VAVVDATGIIVLLNERMEEAVRLRPRRTDREVSIDLLISSALSQFQQPNRRRILRITRTRGLRAPDNNVHGPDARTDRNSRSKLGSTRSATDAGKFNMITIVDISARILAKDRLSATTAERDDLRRRLMHTQEQERLRPRA